MDMVRSILSYSNIPNSFWGHVLQIEAYILNLEPSNSVLINPAELWNRCKPSLWHVWIWGIPTHMLKEKADKLESRSDVYFVYWVH